MTDVVVVNTGSSSLKLDLVHPDGSVGAQRHLDGWDGEVDPIADFISGTAPDAVGHRVVHGGPRFTRPVRVTPEVEQGLRALVPLAPLHQPRALEAMAAATRAAPALPTVACFDTAFHDTLPHAARTYALPRAWRERFGLRKYGMHGLSHASVLAPAGLLVGRDPGELRVVSAHLGSGASLCAIDRGRSVDTTMGMTPLDGLVMATRAGSVDPGILLWLLGEAGMGLDEVTEGLERHSGLTGLAGSTDLGELSRSEDAEGRGAFDIYVHRLVALLAAMAAAMDGLDLLVFTGGVGEHVAEVRGAVGRRLAHLGVVVDPGRNESATPDADVSTHGAAVRTLVVASREHVQVASEVRTVLTSAVG